MKIDLNKSISQVDNWKWKDEVPTRENSGGIVFRFYTLHNQPISKLELCDIRFLIGQNAGLDYLVPIAFKQLKTDIFIETEYYPGDLLDALLSINNAPNYWDTHGKEKQELINLYDEQKNKLSTLDISHDLKKKIKAAVNKFVE